MPRRRPSKRWLCCRAVHGAYARRFGRQLPGRGGCSAVSSVDFQENVGLGKLRRYGRVDFANQIVDLGDAEPGRRRSVHRFDRAGQRSVGVPRQPSFLVRFSESMDRNSVPANAFQLWSTTVHGIAPGMLEDGDRVLRLTPACLSNYTHFTMTARAGFLDLAGRPTRECFGDGVQTADDEPPAVLEVAPSNGAVQVPVDSQLRLLFSEPIAVPVGPRAAPGRQLEERRSPPRSPCCRAIRRFW